MSLWRPACLGLFPKAGESDGRRLPAASRVEEDIERKPFSAFPPERLNSLSERLRPSRGLHVHSLYEAGSPSARFKGLAEILAFVRNLTV